MPSVSARRRLMFLSIGSPLFNLSMDWLDGRSHCPDQRHCHYPNLCAKCAPSSSRSDEENAISVQRSEESQGLKTRRRIHPCPGRDRSRTSRLAGALYFIPLSVTILCVTDNKIF